jgi:hypothetical protein
MMISLSPLTMLCLHPWATAPATSGGAAAQTLPLQKAPQALTAARRAMRRIQNSRLGRGAPRAVRPLPLQLPSRFPMR